MSKLDGISNDIAIGAGGCDGWRPRQSLKSSEQIPGAGAIYTVRSFTDGLQMNDWQADPTYSTTTDIQPLASFPVPAVSDIPALPAMDTWVNLASLGAKGDGETDRDDG